MLNSILTTNIYLWASLKPSKSSLRGRLDRSNPPFRLRTGDCFASLAMTVRFLEMPLLIKIYLCDLFLCPSLKIFKQLKLIHIPFGFSKSFMYVNNCASKIGAISATAFSSTTILASTKKSHRYSVSTSIPL